MKIEGLFSSHSGAIRLVSSAIVYISPSTSHYQHSPTPTCAIGNSQYKPHGFQNPIAFQNVFNEGWDLVLRFEVSSFQ